MLVKDLKRKLKGKFTDVEVLHTDHRNAIPYTLLGKEYYLLPTRQEKLKWINNREVVDYQLSKPMTAWRLGLDFKKCEEYQAVYLTIYIK